ncbi:Transmembrane protein 59 [Dissostichus eleginoides]|uniref:Transmembrane protein 59 n=1 Tax=Dissostichus eleginoides TaxID=100907 RepID=A0AAD9EUD8_DISEL|nr:Transmembrane protein 59 [Dissostichus eleginoides]
MGTLSSFVCVLGLFVLLAFTSASTDAFDSVLGNTASCHKSCEMTYSLHTYPREEELYACQRGCRLFSICQFVRDSDDLNQTKSECESTCREAYTHSDEQYACNLGCQNQLPFAEQRNEQLEAMMPRIHMLYPLTLVRGFWEDVMNQAHSFITSTWTFYLQAMMAKLSFSRLNHKSSFSPKELPRLPFKEPLATRYVPAEKLSIYGDREYLSEKKLTPYPASSLLIITSKGPEEEAGPLPSKVNLGQSDI